MWTEKRFDTGSITVNYADSETPGAPIVLLHGITGWWHDWDDAIAPLSQHGHVYAFDLRGHGSSGRDEDRYTVRDYAADIIAFLRQLDDRALVIGYSLGGMTAIAVASEVHVRAALLVDPPLSARGDTVREDFASWFHTVYAITSSSRTYEDVVAKCRDLMPDEASVQRMVPILWHTAPNTVRCAYESRTFKDFDFGAALERINAPVTLIRADWQRGGLIRDEDADFVRAHVPSVRIIDLHGADHGVLVHHMDIVLREAEHLLTA